MAQSKGMRIFADLAKLVREYPDCVIVIKRNLPQQKKAAAKRFLQAISEAIYRLETEPAMREQIVSNIQKRMRISRKYADDIYEEYNQVFSYPPRVGRDGLREVLEIIARQSGKSQPEFKIDRFLDESLIDELAAEGFFKKLEARNN